VHDLVVISQCGEFCSSLSADAQNPKAASRMIPIMRK
jgi:hypothetical protein